jgi:hypothetical protein
LHQHGQPAIRFRARCGDDALGDLALEHEHGAVVPGWPRLGGDPGDEQRRWRYCRADLRRSA